MEVYELDKLEKLIAKDIMRYLRLHPEIMLMNGNSQAYDYARELRIREAMQNNPNSKYEDVALIIDCICEQEILKFPRKRKLDQALIDCFKPNAKKNEQYYQILLKAIMSKK